jgi:hypothetical protein
MSDDSMVTLFRFLMDYPVERIPSRLSSEWFVNFDDYPGQDFVVALCNEAISETMSGLADPGVPAPNRALMTDYLTLLKSVRSRRLRLLAEAKTPPKKRPKITGNAIKDMESWLTLNEGHPNWEKKLHEYERLVDDQRFEADVEGALI